MLRSFVTFSKPPLEMIKDLEKYTNGESHLPENYK